MVEITPKGRDFIKKGHLWIFANEFKTKMGGLEKGQWTEFSCRGDFVGFGYVNPNSLIAGRICSREKVKDRKAMFFELLKRALERRKSDEKSYRAVFAESDHLPGLIVDVYGNTVVAQSTTAGMDAAKDDWREAILEILKPKNFIMRADSSTRHLEGVQPWSEIVKGDEATLRNGVVEEDDVKIAADFVKGQKTGFFIDQRENRRHLKTIAKGKRVLDLCCYSGGWGLSALRAGAEFVTFVDQSAEAMDLVKRGLELNNFSSGSAKLVVADVFEFLKAEAGSYDIVVCDPPAFVKSKKNIPQAEQAYLRMNALALKVLKPGGYLCTCSCSYHMSEERFTEIVAQAFETRQKEGTIVFRGTQSPDHPWIINRPESRYLKTIVIKASLETRFENQF